jgi:hypothetical protein
MAEIQFGDPVGNLGTGHVAENLTDTLPDRLRYAEEPAPLGVPFEFPSALAA